MQWNQFPPWIKRVKQIFDIGQEHLEILRKKKSVNFYFVLIKKISVCLQNVWG